MSLTHQGRLHFIQYHHLFPKTQLKKAGYDKAAINEIANMAFISGKTNRELSAKPAHEYLAKLLQEQGKGALEGHCIPTDPTMWTVEAYPVFLEYRRAALAQAINDFMMPQTSSADGLDIEKIIGAGESEAVEFKKSARWDYRAGAPNKALEGVICKTITGLSNGKGGTLLIGIDDSGKVAGLEPDYKTLSKRQDRDGYEQFLVNLLSTSMGKEVCAGLSISFTLVDDRDVCAIRVPKSPKPVYVGDAGQTKFYLRTGNTTQELTIKESVEYIKAHWAH